MIKKLVKYGKILMALTLIGALSIPSYATVGASDGSAFVTKAEFDAALSDFNARLTTFEAGINSKIDSQVSSYLDRNGIWNGKLQTLVNTNGLYTLNCLSEKTATFSENIMPARSTGWTNEKRTTELGTKGSWWTVTMPTTESRRLDRVICQFNKSGLCNIEFKTWCEAICRSFIKWQWSRAPREVWNSIKAGTLNYNTMNSTVKWDAHDNFDWIALVQEDPYNLFLKSNSNYNWEFSFFCELSLKSNSTLGAAGSAATVYRWNTFTANKTDSLGMQQSSAPLILITTSKNVDYHNTYFFVSKGDYLMLGHGGIGAPIDTGTNWMPRLGFNNTYWAENEGGGNIGNDFTDATIGLPVVVGVNKVNVY